MIYSTDDLQMMLERTGGAVHSVDGSDLFCRVKGLEVIPDEFGRVMTERQELTHVAGTTFPRRAHHAVDVDGVVWSVIGVRDKMTGVVVWTLEREVG